MKLLELKGFKSLRAFNAFHTLMLGLKMLPSYKNESYEDFFERIEKMPDLDQKKMIREAAVFVPLEREEVEAIISFACDANGVPYGAENLKSLGPDQMIETIIAVCAEIAKIKINDLVNDKEKKNLKISPSTLEKSLPQSQTSH